MAIDPALKDLLKEVYGSVSGYTLLVSSAHIIEHFLQICGLELLKKAIRPMAFHEAPDLEALRDAWNDLVLHSKNPRPRWPKPRYLVGGSRAIPTPRSISDGQNLMWEFLKQDNLEVTGAEDFTSFSSNANWPVCKQLKTHGLNDIQDGDGIVQRDRQEQGWTSEETKCYGCILAMLYGGSADPRCLRIAGPAKTQLSATAASFFPAALVRQPSPNLPLKINASLRPQAGLFGRGVIIKGLPQNATLLQICANIRGGQIERIDFQEGEGRKVVGVYFCEVAAAMEYCKVVSGSGGIYWGGAAKGSAHMIPAAMGGTEKMKTNVVSAIKDGATRCITINNLPASCTLRKLLSDIASQSTRVKPAVEFAKLIKVHSDQSMQQAIIRMNSIGTALGARLMLRTTAYYNDTALEFNADPCAEALLPLSIIWGGHQQTLSNRANNVGERLSRRRRYGTSYLSAQ